MGLFRFIFGLPMAALVTAALFLAMFAMIQQPGEYPPQKTGKVDSFVYQPKPQARPVKERPVNPAEPDLPEISLPPKQTRPGGGDFIVPRPDPNAAKLDPITTGAGAGPSIRVAPAYPEGCRSKGVEGVVIVEFDVTATGDVTNVRVIASPNTCFDRTVKRAVQRWKYTPDTSGGQARPRRGVREVFHFKLTE